MSKALVPTLSAGPADKLFGPAPAVLEAGDLANIERRTKALIGLSLHDFTRAQILAEIDRTMAAIEAYPPTPDLLAGVELSMALPEWSSL